MVDRTPAKGGVVMSVLKARLKRLERSDRRWLRDANALLDRPHFMEWATEADCLVVVHAAEMLLREAGLDPEQVTGPELGEFMRMATRDTRRVLVIFLRILKKARQDQQDAASTDGP